MKTWASWRHSVVPSVTAVMVLAGASLALASARSVRDVVRAARGVAGGATGEAGSSGGSGGGLQLVDIRAGSETGHRGRGGVEDLEGAPGITPGCIAAAASGQSALDSATGLARAMAVVHTNCGANPRALGLANRLARLERHLGQHGAVSHAGGNGNSAEGSDVHGHSGEHGHVGQPHDGNNGGDPTKGQSTDPHGKPVDPGGGNGNSGSGNGGNGGNGGGATSP